MTQSFSSVKTACRPPLWRRLTECAAVRSNTSITPSSFSSQGLPSGSNAASTYAAKVIAASAVGAAKPMVADTQPDTKPAAG